MGSHVFADLLLLGLVDILGCHINRDQEAVRPFELERLGANPVGVGLLGHQDKTIVSCRAELLKI